MRSCLVLIVLIHTGCACTETVIVGDTEADHGSDLATGEPDAWFVADDDAVNWDADDFGTPHVDDPTWEPGIDGLDTVGALPWCNPTGELASSVDVWSDAMGVYVLIEIPRGPHTQAFVYRDAGTGWSTFTQTGGDERWYRVRSIAGLPGRDMLFGYGECNISVITAGGVSWEELVATDLFVVDWALAYSIHGDDPVIMKWNGSSWGPYPGEPLPFEVRTIWADGDVIFCGGEDGLVISNAGDGWTVHDTGTYDGIVDLWGFSPTDVWASTRSASGLGSGILHFDGTTWGRIEVPLPGECGTTCNECHIDELWGADGELFASIGHGILHWNGTVFEILGWWPQTYDAEDGACRGGQGIGAVWGNSPHEVYFVMSYGTGPIAPGCGREYILMWDGSWFHWI